LWLLVVRLVVEVYRETTVAAVVVLEVIVLVQPY
jgi:hypothetical protein